MITHSVFFKLKNTATSIEVKMFFDAAKELSAIPGVQNFKDVKQTGAKNNYEYGLIMEFTSQEVYDRYNDHPMHKRFVEKYWMAMVEDFMEIDYE